MDTVITKTSSYITSAQLHTVWPTSHRITPWGRRKTICLTLSHPSLSGESDRLQGLNLIFTSGRPEVKIVWRTPGASGYLTMAMHKSYIPSYPYISTTVVIYITWIHDETDFFFISRVPKGILVQLKYAGSHVTHCLFQWASVHSYVQSLDSVYRGLIEPLRGFTAPKRVFEWQTRQSAAEEQQDWTWSKPTVVYTVQRRRTNRLTDRWREIDWQQNRQEE